MKKGSLCLCLVLFALLAAPAAAQVYVYVSDNNPASSGGNYWPFGFSSTTGRFMEILDAKFLSVVPGPYKITEVAFSRSGTVSPFTATQFQMRMSHSTATCPLNATFMNNCQPCPTNLIDTSSGFTYALPTVNVWTDIGTLADFGWDGKRNICLEIRYRGRGANRVAMWSDASTNNIPRSWANNTTRDNYNHPTADYTSYCTGGLKVRLTVDPKNVCIAPDTVKVGSTTAVTAGNLNAGDFYQLAASLGQQQLIYNNTCRLFLSVDGVFLYSVMIGVPLFNGYSGTVPASGTVNGKWAVPNNAALIGICVYHAGITFNAKGITGCTNTPGTMVTQ